MKRREFLKHTAAAGAAVFLGSTLAGCLGGGGAEVKTPIEIGTIISLTGDLGSYGVPIQNGAILAAKHINERGGVLGRELRLIHEDDRTTPQGAVEAMQKLVNVNKVPAVIGALGSGNSEAIIPIGRENHVVMISPSSTSPTLTNADDDGYFFRTAASDSFQGKVLVKVARDMGYEKVSHLYINNPYGVAMNDVIKETLPEEGGELVAEVPYNPGQTSYRSELTALTEPGPEAIIFTGYPEYGSVILRQAKELGVDAQWILAEGLKDPLLVEQLGAELVEGMVGTAPKPPSSPQYEAFVEAFKAEFNADPGVYSDTCYDAVMVLAKAIELAGKAEGPAIRDKMIEASLQYDGVSGAVDFDENGDVTTDFEKWAFEGGKIVSKGVVSI
ncbi:MAG: amino acid ABC transporter substrate-binding protein [Methanobacteriota archaeon]|nr:MAG: amino acid ABC transporter substrate-binding protein [Euryarchaeota archaeon]